MTCAGEVTPRQIQVMQALWKSESPKAAAAELGISPKTVERVMAILKERWKQNSYLGVFKIALKKGLIYT